MGSGMLGCGAGGVVPKFSLRIRSVGTAEIRRERDIGGCLHLLNNEGMFVCPSAVSKYPKQVPATLVTTGQPYVCQLLAGGQSQSHTHGIRPACGPCDISTEEREERTFYML